MNYVVRSVAAFAILFACGAQAGEISPQRQMAIRYDDINVKEAAGAQILLARIETASRDVCGPAPDIRNLNGWQLYKGCEKKAVDKAVASLPFDLMASLKNNAEDVAQR